MVPLRLAHDGPARRRTTRAAVAAGLALALGSGLAACGDEEGEPAEGPTSAATSSAGSSAGSSASPSETADDSAGDLVATPFYVGDTPVGPRLFREVHVGVSEEGALDLLMGAPADPDYRTLVPAGSVESFGFDGTGEDGAFSVELADESWTERPAALSEADAALAVQQLVWTLQTVHGGAEPDLDARTAAPVDFYLDGDEVSYLGVPSGATAAPELDVLALMNVVTPAEGDDVSGTLTAVGLGSSFEATVLWEVRDGEGTVVLDGFTTSEGWMDGLYPWTAEVDLSGLEPGDYTFAALTDDPSDGEGNGPTEDTKQITVS